MGWLARVRRRRAKRELLELIDRAYRRLPAGDRSWALHRSAKGDLRPEDVGLDERHG
jgi:hypothetical protein